jgi:hypothetical protein
MSRLIGWQAMVFVVLVVLAGWLVLSVLLAVVLAGLARGGEQEDRRRALLVAKR